MTDEQRYEQALRYAAEKHQGQVRIGGEPYITHPVAVAEALRRRGYGLDYQLTALFHDLLEDTDAAEAEIEALGGGGVLASVRRLTKEKGYQMADYVARVKADPVAFAVKGEDRLHNLRCAVKADEDFRRRYLAETREWYLDFLPDIPAAAEALERTLNGQTEVEDQSI